MPKAAYSAGAIFIFAFLALAGKASADSVFMSCPTLFNNDISNFSANIFIGNPPIAACGARNPDPRQCNNVTANLFRFSVSIDGLVDDLLSCSCSDVDNAGLWRISISTPLQKSYNITAWIVNSTNTISSAYSCNIKRASFQGQFTVPEYSPWLLPFLIFAALFIMRKKRQRS